MSAAPETFAQRLLEWFEVVSTRGHIVNGAVGHFQVTLKVGFRIANS